MNKTKIILLCILLASPFLVNAEITENLKYGAQGKGVVELQEFLIERGFLNIPAPTGSFYSLTLKAVIAYQRSEKLPMTGYVGPMTRAKINTSLISLINTSDTQERTETGAVSNPVTQCPIGFTCVKSDEQNAEIRALKDEVKAQSAILQQIKSNTAKEVVVTPVVTPVEPAKMIITKHFTPSGKVCTSGRKEGHLTGVVLGRIEFKRNQTILGIKEIRGVIADGKENVDNLRHAIPVEYDRTSLIDWSKTNGEFTIKDLEISPNQDWYNFEADIFETATSPVKIVIKSITLKDGTAVEGLPIELETRVFGRCD